MNKIITYFLILLVFILFFSPVLASNLSIRLKGRILLAVEDKGKAWYIDPDMQQRAYLGKPKDAYNIMRELGLGIKHDTLENYLNNIFPINLSGKILLDVENNGEAYYVFPVNLKGYYLGRPKDAFKIMREKGLGITNENLNKISIYKKYQDVKNKNTSFINYDELFSDKIEIDDIINSVGQLTCYDNDGSSYGSASLWKLSGGYAVFTNYHIFSGYKNCILNITQKPNDLARVGMYSLETSIYRTYNSFSDFGFFYLTNKAKTNIEGNNNSANIEDLNYNLSKLSYCSKEIKQGSKVYMIGYPVYGKTAIDTLFNTGSTNRILTDGIISGYADTPRVGDDILFFNYYVTNKIDKGNSGGIALSEENDELCILGIPTWLTVGDYETQGIIQNIHNIFYKK